MVTSAVLAVLVSQEPLLAYLDIDPWEAGALLLASRAIFGASDEHVCFVIHTYFFWDS